ncbi:BTB domain-containing protein [Durusdinium trenchii]|uniref:BTB domain-containing protein n=1 Tax=Durusdinium trenchii TaxID=1381693 RepID=A0ABP0J9B3_9DINO
MAQAAKELDAKQSEEQELPNKSRSAEPLQPPVEIDVTVACVEKEEPQEAVPEGVHTPPEAPSTEPASPAGAPRESLEFSWAPARLPDLGVPLPEDLLNTSSRTYGRPQEPPKPEGPDHALQVAMRQELELSLQRVQQQQYSEHMQQQQPFPKARGTVRQSRLEEVAAEVAGLIPQVHAMVKTQENQAKPASHPVELEALLKQAKDILEGSRLAEQDLESLGWPTRELKAIRELVSGLHKWQGCEQQAKEALGPQQQDALTDVVTVLEQLFTAWRNLSELVKQGDPERVHIHVDLSMESRAFASTPLVSALLDKAIARARHEPDLVAVRRLEALLSWQVELGIKSAAYELGVQPFLEQILKELSECLQGTRRLEQSFVTPGGTMLSTPEVLWRAIVHGDLASVESIIRLGGLVSGRTQDPSGHSVLWNAIAFERPEVALLLLRYFPPDVLHGVALGELHQRNGNSLLHLVSGFQHFSAQCEGLFAMLFERMPEALRIHRNLRGQSFLHIAAGRRNFWILNYAASRGLASQFSVSDTGGFSPQRLLGQHLELMQLHRPELKVGGTKMPAWCTFGGLQPPAAGVKAPFVDVALEVGEDQRVYAHKVILAAGSQKWHQHLRMPCSNGDMQVLKITSCDSVEVVNFALRYLYTGNTELCSFQKDCAKLRALLLFCQSEELPSSLVAWVADSLLQAESGFVASLLLEAPRLGLPPAAQRYLAYRFICDDDAWQAAAEAEVNGQNGSAKVSVRGAALTIALSALESAQFGA